MKKKSIPILITAYNRYVNFKKLFTQLHNKNYNIYISIDGPKNSFDKSQQIKIINLLNKNKIHKYRILDKNHGCQKAVFLALDWFFFHEKKGIILEDDILPGEDFFKFCEILLKKFANEKKIFSISGYNPLNKLNNGDYFLSKYFMCWGWATWRDRWKIAKRFVNNNQWTKLINSKPWQESCHTKIEKDFFTKIFKKIKLNQIDSWAFLWLLIGVSNSSRFILPKYNLINNTGINIVGANNVPSKLNIKVLRIHRIKSITHQKTIPFNQEIDKKIFFSTYNPKNILYPWRLVFILKSLIFDTKFFFKKLYFFFKKKYN